MGVSSSNTNKSDAETNYQKFINTYSLPKAISKNDFIRSLTYCDHIFLNNVWNYTVGSESYCTESQFDEIVDHCRFRTGSRWLRYLVSVAGIQEIASKDQIRLLFNCLSFSCEALYTIVSKSLPCMASEQCDINMCLTWLDRNLPELGIDLARYMYRTLTCQLTNVVNINAAMADIYDRLQSDVISPCAMALLCASLPMSYKTSDNVEEFVFMNMDRWTMMYSSDRHGLSASKFRENAFDYSGNLILLIKCDSGLFCVASDVGLKEDWNVYGGIDARLLQLEPIFKKHITGSRSGTNKNSGIIYSHFTAKSSRRGLFVGHSPPNNVALELDEDLTNISVMGRSEPIRLIEAWAVGSGVDEKMARLKDVRHWEKNEVSKHKNRKIKAEDWTDSPDREILGLGGVNVRNADMVGGIDRDLDLPH